MNSADIFQTISIIVIILGGISGIVWTTFKGKKELKKQDIDINAGAIDSSRDALEIVTMSTKQVLELRREIADAECRMKADREALTAAYAQQIDELKTEASELKLEIKDVKDQLTERDRKLEELQDWAERLVHQVQSLGEIPVPLKPKKPKEKI